MAELAADPSPSILATPSPPKRLEVERRLAYKSPSLENRRAEADFWCKHVLSQVHILHFSQHSLIDFAGIDYVPTLCLASSRNWGLTVGISHSPWLRGGL